MRFETLSIPAFGPFTDFSLSLPKTESGYDLHLIYGANEQGKSSLLRAIDQMLFGIPARSSDNFLHQNTKLRIGATIHSNDKSTLSFLRKKGNTNTLLDKDAGILNESELASHLGPVTQSFFQSMFGLTTESLRSGATALIAGEGNLGDTLFSASLGNTPIDAAIEEFQSEAESLFKPTGSKNSITKALSAYKTTLKSAKEHSTTVVEWKAHTQKLTAAKKHYSEKNRRLNEANSRRLTLERTLTALPNISRLQGIEEQLKLLSHIPDLPNDFILQVRTAQSQIDKISLQLESNKLTQTELSQKLETFSPRSDVLALEAEINALYQALPNYLDLINQVTTVSVKEDISQIPSITKRTLTEHARITNDVRSYREKLTTIQTHISQLEDEQAALSLEIDATPANELPAELSALNDRISRHTSELTQVNKLTLKLHSLEKKRTSLWHDSPVTPSGQLPSCESVTQHIQTLQKLDQLRLKNLEKQTEIHASIVETESQLTLLQKHTPLTSREELLHSRHRRDSLIQTSLENGKIDPQVPTAVSQSDNIADSLHTHAENITQANTHLVQLEKLQAQHTQLEVILKQIAEEITQTKNEWDSQITASGLDGYTPHQFIEWKDTWDKHLIFTEEIDQLTASLDQITHCSDELVVTLQKTLESEQKDFDILRTELQQDIEHRIKSSGSRQTLLEQDKALTKKHRDYSARLKEIESHYNSSIEELNELSSTYTVEMSIPELYEAQQQLIISEKIGNIQTRINSASKTLLGKKNLPEDAAVSELKQLLDDHKNLAVKFTLTQESLDFSISEHETQSLALTSAKNTLTQLRQAAESQDLSSLEKTLSSLEEKIRLSKQAEELRDSIATGAAGSLKEFIQQATTQSESALKKEQQDLDLSLPLLQEERDAARAELQTLEANEKDLQQASSHAAEENQNAQLHLASLTSDARRFIQLQHAIHFLREQIDLYRQRSQGPMLTLTSTLFSQLTSGAFTHVSAQLSEKGDPILVGVRSDKSEIRPQHMSEGTTDQLYLALRLAAIQLHLKAHPAMPLILDDLLMSFDDERTQALLPILAELSTQTQILVFTHHQHLDNLFEKAIPDKFQRHML